MRAILVREFGGPEVLQPGEIELPTVGEDEIHARVEYAGVNFLDLHHRAGTYKRELPLVPGREGSGIVLAKGAQVTHLQVGDRIAFAMHEGGTYAEEAVIPAWKVAPVPADVDLRTAAAVMLQGLTAVSLVTEEARLTERQVVLVHSAAGGTGSLMVQVARQNGARVLGLASTQEKVRFALESGASVAGTYPEEGFSEWVKDQTAGRGVDVVLGAVGGPTFEDDLNCLAPRGRLVIYGRSGGAFPLLDPARLADGCLSITYARLSYYVGTFANFQAQSRKLFALVQEGVVKPLRVVTLPSTDAALAHRALATRSLIGKQVLDMTDGVGRS